MAPLGVGDCIAVTDLLIKIAKVFKESGGAVEEYQDLEEYAIALNAGLGHLHTLEQDPTHQTPAAFRQALNLCEKSLQQLCQRQAKYGTSLSKHAKTNKVSLAFRKMQWALLSSKDMKDLRTALNSEMTNALSVLVAQLTEGSTKLIQQSTGMRNLLENFKVEQEVGFNSLTAKIERLGLDTESKITDATNALTQKITSSESTIIDCYRPAPQPCFDIPSNPSRNVDELLRDALVNFESSMESQMQRLMRAIHVELAQVKSTERSSAKTPLEDTDVAAGAATLRHRSTPQQQLVESCVKGSTREMKIVAYMLGDALRCFWIYLRALVPIFIQTLASFQRSIALVRQPILLAQDSISFLDALGRTHNLPFIFFQNYKVLEPCLRSAFRRISGEERVSRGAYVLHNLQTRQVVKDTNWNQAVFPGSKVGMSMVITEAELDIGYCPRPTCRYPFEYRQTKTIRSFTCPECQLCFSVSEAKRTDAQPPQIEPHIDDRVTQEYRHEDISAFQRIHILQSSNKPRTAGDSHRKLEHTTCARSHFTGAWEYLDSRDITFYCCHCGMGPWSVQLYAACMQCGASANNSEHKWSA